MSLRARPGFSLFELFTVLVIIGILTAIMVPRIHMFKRRFYVATMITDLRNLGVAEESYWSTDNTYTTDLNAMRFTLSPQVTVTFVQADSLGWSATSKHANDTVICAVYYGNAAVLPPATAKTIIGCQ